MKTGTVLNTKNSEVHTNAVVMESSSKEIKVLTDFGNILVYPDEFAVLQYFSKPLWWDEYHELDYPMRSVTERLKEQITKLQSALFQLQSKKN